MHHTYSSTESLLYTVCIHCDRMAHTSSTCHHMNCVTPALNPRLLHTVHVDMAIQPCLVLSEYTVLSVSNNLIHVTPYAYGCNGRVLTVSTVSLMVRCLLTITLSCTTWTRTMDREKLSRHAGVICQTSRCSGTAHHSTRCCMSDNCCFLSEECVQFGVSLVYL